MNQRDYRSSGQPQSRPPQGRPPQRKKKYRFKPNKEGMQALLILVIIAALIITLLVLTVKGIAGAISKPDETTTAETTTGETTTETPVVVKKWYDDYVKEAHPTSDLAVGELILVNKDHAYELTDTLTSKMTNLYGSDERGSTFVVSNANLYVRREIYPHLVTMLKDLNTAFDSLGTTVNTDQVLVVSGHRTTDYQKDLYENSSTEDYVAEPGRSEHHTGFAVDLKVLSAINPETQKRHTEELRDDEQAWMDAHCADYGFIRRYDGAKYELTGILDETWHFRYVGKPHAQYITENGLCLEEYLTLLSQSYNIETCDGPLVYTIGEGDTAENYEIYYVPASLLDTTTDVPVPKKTDVKSITVSGDNIGGFIVTVQK